MVDTGIMWRSGLRWIVTALALVGSASVVLVLGQGTKDPSNPIPPYQTYQQPLPSNTTPADVERLSILQRALLLRSVGPYRGFEGPIPRSAADANLLRPLLFGLFVPVRVVALPLPCIPAHIAQVSRRVPAQHLPGQLGAGVAAGDVAWAPGRKNDGNIFAACL